MKGKLTQINSKKIVVRAFMLYFLCVVQWNWHPEVGELWRWRGITDQALVTSGGEPESGYSGPHTVIGN
jgi:hypothetical protein